MKKNISNPNLITLFKNFEKKVPQVIYFLLSGGLFLGLVAFLPFSNLGIIYSKNLLLTVIFGLISIVSIFLWIGSEKIESVSNKKYAFALSFLVAVVFASLLNAPNLNQSFFGYGLSPSSALSIIIVLSLSFISFFLATKKKSLVYVLGALFLGHALTFLHLIIFWVSKGKWLNFEIFNNNFSNLSGSWNDFLILNSLILLISIFSLYFLKKQHKLRIFLIIYSILTGLIIFSSGSIFNIGLLAILFFGIFIYAVLHYYSSHENQTKNLKRLPFIPLTAFLVSVLALFISPIFNNFLSQNIINLKYSELRIGLTDTSFVVENSLRQDLLTGLGPNTFDLAWQSFRPKSVIQDSLSDLPLQSGYSWILTQASNLGLLGLVGLLIIFVLTLQNVFWQFQKPIISAKDYYGLIFSFLALFLWFSIILSNSGIYFIALAFIFSGFTAGFRLTDSIKNDSDEKQSLLETGSENGKIIDNLPLWHSVSMAVLIGLVILSVFFGIYFSIKIIRAEYFYNQSIKTENKDQILPLIEKAAYISNQDRFYRLLAQTRFQFFLQKVGNIDQSSGPTNSQRELVVKELEFILSDLQKAIIINNSNYQNYLILGDVFLSLYRLGFEDSINSAENYYQQALLLYPTNIQINWRIAQVAIANKNLEKAENILITNLSLRYSDLDSLLLLASIYKQQNRKEETLEVLKRAVGSNPNSFVAVSQLALELENQNKISDVIAIYENILISNPDIDDVRNRLIKIYESQNNIKDAQRHLDYFSVNS